MKEELERLIVKYLDDMKIWHFGLNISERVIRIAIPMKFIGPPKIKKIIDFITKELNFRNVKIIDIIVKPSI